MHIGILQTGHAADPIRDASGDYDAMFHRLLDGRGFDFTTWNVVDGDFPEGPGAAEGWLITGSRHGAYEDLPWIAPLEDLIREIHATGRPLVGICFGHQIVAQALGGRVEKYRGGWSVGPQSYRIEGREYRVAAWHQDQVVEPPAEAEIVGSSAFCPYAALRYDRALTLQPHPEFDRQVLEGLIAHRSETVPDDLVAAARGDLAGPLDQAPMADLVADILKGAA